MTNKATATDGGSQEFYAQTSQDMPLFYDQGLGPIYFVDFAEDIARRAAALAPVRVLEVASAPRRRSNGEMQSRPRERASGAGPFARHRLS